MRDKSFQIHLIITIIITLLSFLLKISLFEWLLVSAVIVAVMITEIINSSIELFCDLVNSQQHDKIKVIKDIMAGAVLITSLYSILVGLFVFYPKIYSLIKGIQ